MVDILRGVRFDLALLQKYIQIPAGADAQERAELIGGDTALPVCFQADCFQDGAGGVLAAMGPQQACWTCADIAA